MLAKRILLRQDCIPQICYAVTSHLRPSLSLTACKICKNNSTKIQSSTVNLSTAANFKNNTAPCEKLSTGASQELLSQDNQRTAVRWLENSIETLNQSSYHFSSIPYANNGLYSQRKNLSLSLVRASRPGMLGVGKPKRSYSDSYIYPQSSFNSSNPNFHEGISYSLSQENTYYSLVNTSHELLVTESDHSNQFMSRRFFHTTTSMFDSKPSSQVEVTVNALKEKAKEKQNAAAAAADAAEDSSVVSASTSTVTDHKSESFTPTQSELIHKAVAETAPPPVVVEKKSLWVRFKEEVVHYYHGFRLLFIDTKIGIKYCYRILNGDKLSRREHRQLVRTTGDLFRLLPFSVFIIIPFMELLLPVALKLFPGMLPSTFETANEKEAKMKKRLKVKLEMAKFLQETLDSMSLQSKDHKSKSAKEFVLFFEKVRSTGEEVTNEEILKFSKLFADSITLDSLSRPQLTALCQLLEMQPFGTNNFLRFQLRMKLRSLVADDKLIAVEGVESLSSWELQQACRTRGMRAYGMTDARLQQQLKQWLELSLDKKVPPSLLLLSRTLYLPDALDAKDSLAATISQLPEEVKTRTKAAIGKREGKIDNRTRLEVIQGEEKRIEEDKKDMEEEKKKKIEAKKKVELGIGEAEVVSIGTPAPSVAADAVVAQAVKVTKATVTPAGEVQADKEEMIDKAPVLQDTAPEMLDAPQLSEKEAQDKAAKEKAEELSSEDLAEVEEALETIGAKQRRLLIEEQELSTLKGEMQDYQEDIEDFKKVLGDVPGRRDLRESKAARRLFARINRLLAKTEPVIKALNAETEQMHKVVDAGQATKQQKTTLVNLEDLVQHLRQVADAPNSAKLDVIKDVLTTMDTDHDGAIKLEHILKAVDALSEDQVEVPRKVFEEVVIAMTKEEQLETKTVVQKAINATKTPPINTDHNKTDGVAEIKQS